MPQRRCLDRTRMASTAVPAPFHRCSSTKTRYRRNTNSSPLCRQTTLVRTLLLLLAGRPSSLGAPLLRGARPRTHGLKRRTLLELVQSKRPWRLTASMTGRQKNIKRVVPVLGPAKSQRGPWRGSLLTTDGGSDSAHVEQQSLKSIGIRIITRDQKLKEIPRVRLPGVVITDQHQRTPTRLRRHHRSLSRDRLRRFRPTNPPPWTIGTLGFRLTSPRPRRRMPHSHNRTLPALQHHGLSSTALDGNR